MLLSKNLLSCQRNVQCSELLTSNNVFIEAVLNGAHYPIDSSVNPQTNPPTRTAYYEYASRDSYVPIMFDQLIVYRKPDRIDNLNNWLNSDTKRLVVQQAGVYIIKVKADLLFRGAVPNFYSQMSLRIACIRASDPASIKYWSEQRWFHDYGYASEDISLVDTAPLYRGDQLWAEIRFSMPLPASSRRIEMTNGGTWMSMTMIK